MSVAPQDSRKLVLHVVYSFDVGGLENGIVNLINNMPADAYRHAIVALTKASDFKLRIKREDVLIVQLHKPPGQGIWLYPRLFRLFRQLRPTIVHTRNLAALETMVPAWLAGVPVRIHGEHGRDVDDLDGSSQRHRWMRRIYRPFVHHYFAVSRDLAEYLAQKIDVAPQRITQVYNGVDSGRFRRVDGESFRTPGSPFAGPIHWTIGTVGRMQHVKDQTLLANAFVLALQRQPALRSRLRLVMVGDGPLRLAAQAILDAAGVAEIAWLPGERNDVPDVMRGIDCFVLPSLAEGISNTILEAMASGLPVIATRVGGNADLVEDGKSGLIVPPGDANAMADAIRALANDPNQASAMGAAGRQIAEQKFSIRSMVQTYQGVYDHRLRANTRAQRTAR
ncbi:glycosyltransferase [soil metagenome]